MGSMFQRFKQQGLPLSHRPADSNVVRCKTAATHTEDKRDEEQSWQLGGIRRRLSSLSLKMQLQPMSSSPSWGALRRSKSASSFAGDSIRKWWDWGWTWILSRKPTFAKDLEMNDKETAALGCHHKGSWRHVFYKLKSELGRLVGSSQEAGLPQTFRYDHGKRTPFSS